ncbi:MAG: tRNA uridine-5-carboxymethylaminomethyl(34) synthesis GTPase MnmE [Gammaproteobacteria bacterium]
MTATDTIAAVATPPGRGALGVVRASGPLVPRLLATVTGSVPTPRSATLRTFMNGRGEILDRGLVLYFPAPASYTGEDMCEFHAHGNPHLLRALLECLHELGARPARPGEFTERAFRNGKLDLAQAEAVADVIEAGSLRATQSALRSLRGEFSRQVIDIVARLTDARVALEGSIDFPDDLPPAATAERECARIVALREGLTTLLDRARHGARLAAGASVAIVGAPNVGKSTLMNALAGEERAIVSQVPGTTRDVIAVDLELAGMALRLHDTAGLRASADEIELEGMRRAGQAMASADLVVLVTDDAQVQAPEAYFDGLGDVPVRSKPLMVVHNKIDRVPRPPGRERLGHIEHVFIAARDGQGLDLLHAALQDSLALTVAEEDEFTARARHLQALAQARDELVEIDLERCGDAPELVAESLRRAAETLATITGDASTEALLGEIFARFCIGK